MNMRKLHWFFIIIAVIANGLLAGYAFVEDWKPLIGGVFASARDFLVGQFTAFSTWFQTLPYWPVIGMGITFALGILFWYKIDTIQHAIPFWGYRKTTQPIFREGPPKYEPPQSIPQELASPSAPPAAVTELEVKQE